MVQQTMIMKMMYLVVLFVYEVLDILALGAWTVIGNLILCWGLGAVFTVIGASVGIRILRSVAEKRGLTAFSFYSFGVALFTFILYLVV